ncbi:Gfo/Idh/MocA family oxidoreductase [Candidatus Sumerlaeota bacterium]|nr:Gfo/Idh/MocA family oxidoreductase [Candidatus Sumerlaeota bacterium]
MTASASRRLNVGVVGCGYWGPNLVRNFDSIETTQIKKVCDASPERLAHMKRLYPSIDVATDFDELVEDPEIDAIAVATPVQLHHRLGMKCLEAGKHTFIEKPMALSSAQCDDLIDLAHRNRLTLMIGHTFIYTSEVRKIKDILDSGEIGDVLYISARRLNLGLFQKDINVAWDLAPHDISIILFLLGADPVTVNCQGKAHVAEGIEDVTNMSLDFADGRFATIMSSWLDPNKVREMTIVGSKKMLVYNDIVAQEKIKIYDKRVEVPPHYDTFAEFRFAYHYGDIYSPHVQQIEPLRVECEHFANCIADGSAPMTDGADGKKVVEILEASSASLRRNGASIPLARPDVRAQA